MPVFQYPMWLNLYNTALLAAFIASFWVFPGHFWRDFGIFTLCSAIVSAPVCVRLAINRERERELDAEAATTMIGNTAEDIARMRRHYDRTHRT
jgi:hypothetical protein